MKQATFRWLPRGLLLLTVVGSGVCMAGAAPEWVSGERLALGGDRRGPMSAGLSTYPLGVVRLPGREFATLFVAAGRFSHTPGLFAHDWHMSSDGPLLGMPERVRYPFDTDDLRVAPPSGLIFQTRDGHVYGFWIHDGFLIRTRLETSRNEFLPLAARPIPLGGLPGAAPSPRTNPDGRAVERLGIIERDDGSLLVVLSVPDPTIYLPAAFQGRRDPDFDPYDGRGLWRGGLPRVFLFAGTLPGPEAEVPGIADLRQVSPTQREALFSHGSLVFPDFGGGAGSHLVTGSYLGVFYHYRLPADSNELWPVANLVRGTDGRALRNGFVWTSPVVVPGLDGRVADLVVGGEGALQYYRFVEWARDGTPVYEAPRCLPMENALLYTGSLPVINAVDWDGDGVTDLVVGNSEGRILFFRNHGTQSKPDFRRGEALAAGGEIIHIQPGYAALQGPDEARWAYVSPVVVDWDGDGLPDILASDARAMHYLFRNIGTLAAPRLAAPAPLFCDGLDIHGTWRVRPGAARWGGAMAYVALDSDDEFRLYWRVDDVNLRDGGKLRLEDGSTIGANYLHAGGTGRTKFTLADWDGDGVMDVLVGTPRHGSVPNPRTGLPQSLGLPGAAVLWLRNTGSHAEPRFAFPRVLHFRGQPVFFGQHACSLALADLGGPGGPHMLVGDEEGRIHYFAREDISWGP